MSSYSAEFKEQVVSDEISYGELFTALEEASAALGRPGKPLRVEPPDKRELEGLIRSGRCGGNKPFQPPTMARKKTARRSTVPFL